MVARASRIAVSAIATGAMTTELREIATLHLGPGAILVALTLAFRPKSTTEMLNQAVFEITRCLKETDGRVAYVYVRPAEPVD